MTGARLGSDTSREINVDVEPQALFLTAAVRRPQPFRNMTISTKALAGVAWNWRSVTANGSAGRTLVLAAAILALGIAAWSGALISQLRERALITSEEGMGRLALVLAQQADRSLQSIDLVESGLLESLKGVETSEQYRREMTGIAVHHDLRNRIQGLPQIDTLTVLDSSGTILNYSRAWPIPFVNVADRDFFKLLKSDAPRKTFISEPILSRAISAWTVVLARKVAAPDGTFLGLIVCALDLSDFESLYEAAGLGANSSVTLLRQDGVQLARYPHVAPDTGRSPIVGERYAKLLAAGSGREQVRLTDETDGQQKLLAVQLLPGHPLGINVEMTVDQALTDWRKQTAYIVAAAALLELVIVAIVLLMTSQLRSQRLLVTANSARTDAETELTLSREREAAQRQARVQDARLSAALDSMSQGLGLFDATNRLVVANARCEAILGIPAGSEVGLDLADLLDSAVSRSAMSRETAENLMTGILASITGGERISYVQDGDDGRSLAVNFSPIASGGWLVTLEDVTERRRAEAQVAHLAHHDSLTGLANRLLFRERLESALALSRRDEGFAILYLDLDRFKNVNDTLGHSVGDGLLRAVADRMLTQVRETDTVARLGGDEFAIIQAGVDQPIDATHLSERLIEALSAPYDLEDHGVTIGATVGVSIGIAILPGDGDDGDTVLKNADLALYQAKSEGRGIFRFFEPKMNPHTDATRIGEASPDHGAGRAVQGHGDADVSARDFVGLILNRKTARTMAVTARRF
jgi:diguanylate cyclase (GGDEF)-like protein